VYQAKRTGNKFLPLPGTYSLAKGEMARGGQVVRTTDVEGLYSVVENQQESPSVGLARRNDSLFRKMKKMNTKANGSLNSPVVTNPVKPSPVSSSGNVSIMDPRSAMSNTSIVSSSSSPNDMWRTMFG
jgi:hypothetical protein